MSVVAGAVIGAAVKVGASMVKNAIQTGIGGKAGSIAGELAGSVIDAVAAKAGVEPDDLPAIGQSSPEILEEAVKATEVDMPEIVAMWTKGLEGQFELLQAETKEGFWQSFWRWGWMYLLAVFWVWRIIVLPIANRVLSGAPIEAVEFAVLLTLTSWFMALYMGGHTLKELGKNALDAVRGWKGGK